ncbi:MAG: DEAD/DEAH box helicase, partial [Gemmatimonadota bacterium]|nr:DEAD/DEAH box helicase [Gemmatimonadota bacterium]
ARNESVQAKLQQTDWDLVVVDEAHKMSASFTGGEIRPTKRHDLGQMLSKVTRNFILMTATPHNGKEEDFQLFMRLIDPDRFEGKFRGGTHRTDTSDLMRRLVKENLLKFDGTRLFPERCAYTVNYDLSPDELELYERVTEYVRDEFNRAENLDGDTRGTVGFALTILQRRLASSPEAIYQSLRRRRERLQRRIEEERTTGHGITRGAGMRSFTADDLEDLEDAPESEVEETEERVVDQASAARTIAELEAEIATLERLEGLAYAVRRAGRDRKWEELSGLLQTGEMFDAAGKRRKLIVFTEHRDTLNYLDARIRTLLGRDEAVVRIHGGIGREQRLEAQEAFRQNEDVQVLVATDAAGEGINLQRANLLVNYDLPWNPNRLEQRFGRIHRIGQTEVCHMWNLVARETREGYVYHRLLEKLEEQRAALGGQVFDILNKVAFQNRPLRDLLVDAVRYGDRPEARLRFTEVVDRAFDREHLLQLIEQHALVQDSLDTSQVRRIREEMERAEARRLQPHFIADFFLTAFRLLGGTVREREPGRYEVSYVPAAVRNRMRAGRGSILRRYERITFEKGLIAVQGKPLADFVFPGHPLLDATIALVLDQYRDQLKRGAVLVDPTDSGEDVRALFFLEHSLQDARKDQVGHRRVISRRMQFVELDRRGGVRSAGYAPYLDYRPLTDEERPAVEGVLQEGWVASGLEGQVLDYAVTSLVPEHLEEVRGYKEELISKTMREVKARLTAEIGYWDRRATELKNQELAGRTNARLNSGLARQRANNLEARLAKRMEDLEQERR